MLRAIRRFWERGRKGFTLEDMWSFDNWLSQTITRGLKEFRANVHGYPSEAVTFERWLEILDEMIKCFEAQTRTIDNLPNKNQLKVWQERQAYKKKQLKRGLQLLQKYYYDLWD